MIEILQSFNLTLIEWIIVAFCAIGIGFTKTGISGSGLLIVAILASIFQAKPSVGLILPMLCIADIFAIRYYHHHADWSKLWQLLPWALIGIALGLFIGNIISDTEFRIVLAVIILSSLVIMISRSRKNIKAPIKTSKWLTIFTGLAGGFTTMISNAAGPIMSIYLLHINPGKYTFMGTRAWFFFIVNLIKLPLHIFFWKTITVKTLVLTLSMLPAIALGAFIGIKVVKYIPERLFRIIIIILVAAACIKMLI